ncbi:MAG: cell division ATP-binding protein FtsE [candidate division WOR-3 bacterium]|jgi:cell division transport system ATP-binding protein
MSPEGNSAGNSLPAVELTGVFKYYQGDWPALTDISLTVYPGDFLFLLGATGAGKTTLLRLLYRQELPDAGSIKVLGYDLLAIKPREIPLLRRKLGVIFQDFKLLSDRTVYENLEFVLRAINTQPDMIPAKIQETLNQLGLVHKKNSYPYELSGGEQQKVSIARALVKSPDIILADEPTGNIDPKAADDILNILKDINYQGTTVIMATHDAELAERSRRRRVTLDAGRIVSDEG